MSRIARNPAYRYLNHSPLIDGVAFDEVAAKGQSMQVACWACGHVVVRHGSELCTAFGGRCTAETRSGTAGAAPGTVAALSAVTCGSRSRVSPCRG